MSDLDEFEEAVENLLKDFSTFLDKKAVEYDQQNVFAPVVIHIMSRMWLTVLLKYAEDDKANFLICAFLNDVIANAVEGFDVHTKELNPELKTIAIEFLNDIDINLAIIRNKIKALN